jgi:hypothetical protein
VGGTHGTYRKISKSRAMRGAVGRPRGPQRGEGGCQGASLRGLDRRSRPLSGHESGTCPQKSGVPCACHGSDDGGLPWFIKSGQEPNGIKLGKAKRGGYSKFRYLQFNDFAVSTLFRA